MAQRTIIRYKRVNYYKLVFIMLKRTYLTNLL